LIVSIAIAKELQWKSTKFIIDGWMDEKHQHDITTVVIN
jgi:hypothetical protein